MLTLIGCDDAKPKTIEKPKPKPLEKPCTGGIFVLRHSYPQCQADGFWHIVEDDYYKCPPESKITGFRVRDTNTAVKCGSAIPSPIGTIYPKYMINAYDTICTPAGDLVVPECVNSKWVNITYTRYVCYIYQAGKIIDSTSYARNLMSINDSTNVPCDSVPPVPKMK